MVDAGDRMRATENIFLAIIPRKIDGRWVWLKYLKETRVDHLVDHETCSDCFNPHSLCDKNPKWVTVSLTYRVISSAD